MFCPNCGKSEQIPETYCRQCGTFLTDFSRKNKQFSFGGDTPQEQIRTGLILNSLSAIVSLASAFALYIIFWDRRAEFPSVFFIAAFLMAVGAWQLSTFFVSLKLRRNLNKGKSANNLLNEIHQTQDSNQISAPETGKILMPADLSNSVQASVTENTTKHLDKISRK